jgi:hypothetical protein
LRSVHPARSLEAVVSGFTGESVFLNCFAPGGEIEVKFPITVVPAELRAYGQPVYLSLETDRGYRVPVVKKREIPPQPMLPGEQEIDEWIASL